MLPIYLSVLDTSEAERSPCSHLTGAGAWVWRPARSPTDFRAGSVSPPPAPVLLWEGWDSVRIGSMTVMLHSG